MSGRGVFFRIVKQMDVGVLLERRLCAIISVHGTLFTLVTSSFRIDKNNLSAMTALLTASSCSAAGRRGPEVKPLVLVG